MFSILRCSCVLAGLVVVSSRAHAQQASSASLPHTVSAPGAELSHQKLSNHVKGFRDTLDEDEGFSFGLTALGDLDGDGNEDLAASSADFSGIEEPGAIYILFLADDGSLRGYRKLDAYHGMLAGEIGLRERLGAELAGIGDLDGDGVPDLLSHSLQGVLRVFFLRRDGSVKAIATNTHADAGTVLAGFALASIGDLNGDGATDVAMGRSGLGDVQIFFLARNGAILAHQRIAPGVGGFSGTVDGLFGMSVAGIGDLDGDGTPDLAVGERGRTVGSVWVLFLRPNGKVRTQVEITGFGGGINGFGQTLAAVGDVNGDGRPDVAASVPSTGLLHLLHLNANGSLASSASFVLPMRDLTDLSGWSLAGVADLDGDGGAELAVGAYDDDDGNPDAGAVYLVSLAAGSELGQATAKISDRPGSLEGTLDNFDLFGSDATLLGDLDGDGVGDLAVGAPGDGIMASPRRGAAWVLLLEPDGTVKHYQKIGVGHGNLAGVLDREDRFGTAVEALGDLDGDGTPDVAVGAIQDDDGGFDRGAVYVLFLLPDGRVKAEQKISRTQGGFTGQMTNFAHFGSALTTLGDLDGNGVVDLAVGATGDDDGVMDAGATWVLFLESNGTVAAHQKISLAQGGFAGSLAGGDGFGTSLEALGDLDGDGVTELAVGASGANDGGPDRGSVWVCFLRADGTVKAQQEISDTEGSFQGLLDDRDGFGNALAALGDLDLDGVTELAVGAPGDDDGGSGSGAVWLLSLHADGSVASHEKISATRDAGYVPFRRFGAGLAPLGDRDGDGVPDLVVGIPDDYDGGQQHGALYLVALDGLARAGFERGDDALGTKLVNGQALVATGAFGRTLELASAGANLGPAIFDSTPLGPNDPSQDRDLLVGKQNLVILQNSLAPTQTVPGIFDRPNDDQDGGTLTLRFPAPVAPLALDLIDIDPGAAQSSSVALVDAAGRTRIYSVPGGWTEDLLTNGPPAWRTLDLTTLLPQAGFRASATASELAGFDANAVVRIEVELGSSGAIDELRWDPHPGP